MIEQGASVATYLSLSADQTPDTPALVSGSLKPSFSTLSFLELDQTVDRAVVELLGAGIQQGDKTLLFVNPGPELIVWAFALFRLGAIPVVIDPGMGIQSFLKCIKRTKPKAMVGVRRALWVSRIFPGSFKTVRKQYTVRAGYYGERHPGNRLVKNIEISPDQLAAIVFTSGSTGSPKGVRYLYRTFDTQIQTLKNSFGMMPGEVDLTTLPIFGLFNPALGITSVLPDIDPRKPANANPQNLVHALVNHQITTAFASPVIGKKILSACAENNTLLPHMNRFFMAGAPVPPRLVEELQTYLPNGAVIVPYGATEALPISSTHSSDISRHKESILAGEGSLIGKPVPGAKVCIVPSIQSPLADYEDNYSGLLPGEVGEICVSGSMVSDGYDRMPGATCDARFKIGMNSYHRMGDLGYFDSMGQLRFLGRKVECVMTANGPLETERCEPSINQLPFVQKCALIGLGDTPVQEPCLVIEPIREKVRMLGEFALRREVLDACEKMFSDFRFQRVFFEKKLPVDARHNAKIHRLALSKKWTKRVSRKPGIGKIL